MSSEKPSLPEIQRKFSRDEFEFSKHAVDQSILRDISVSEVREAIASGEIVDGERKASLLASIAAHEGFSLEQTIAVGDGANNPPMLSIAGLGIAFRAKPMVKESAKQSLNTLGLDGILYLMGLSERETKSS
jgi:cation transport ATPase